MANQDIWNWSLQANDNGMQDADGSATGGGGADSTGGSDGGGQTLTSRVCPRGYSRYTWRSGDTLDSVAASYGLRPEAIQEANPGIVFTRLNFGDEICIPFAQAVCPTGAVYTVRRGDTFTSIAAYFGITVLELTELNPYADPAALQPGQVLCVPAQRPVTPIAPPGSAPAYPGGSSTGGCVSDCVMRPEDPTQYGCAADSITILMPSGWSFATLLTRYGVSYNALQSANPGISIDAIPVGQRLCIPPAGSRRLCEADGTRSHIIEQNETLSSLAQRFNTTVGNLLRLNPEFAPADFIAGRVICAPE